ncbi:capsular polysaccharide biosynthesis protein [Streptomyces sp. SAI-208]|uniref:Wzz/FepE/Etk N-terminal domain-containing protein n=1 Tax=unclassified Streptomyces TaxID=2593676 RepID=UPI0024740284|nr:MULTISPECIES: Wzz/FepE/Etk N-terminal domain-containing protein [unclassified Streptomyces]MDH6547246.1 capsular polysaccharide biosynthesis protein [Streptomyces sp. SAI-041]MDH6566325.1 capsular polysaccharide biosynthesis protein [Streptomyces sp. SAI-117]MDH6588735.1 capsular polysaccharide biosynthesis protein [Streptomyces sp. SAI-133]MDH6605876.1 capsular polysaccharide biosynthesis protein [Streptomyces sp. SAI-208]
MTTNTTSPESAATPLLDLQALVVAVRRRRRLWCAMAVLGFSAGAAVAVLMPPPPSATTKVLVAHAEDQPNDTGTLIRTDVALLHTTRIADAALKSLKSPEKPADFMKDYQGTGLTNNLLQIEVTGDDDAQAVARAKALADAFVADHVQRMKATAQAEAKALLDQRDRTRDELASVNKQINERAEAGDTTGAASLESLYARRAELNSRISDFDARAADARTGTPAVVAGTQIVDAPSPVRHSLPKAAATDAGIGLVLGLFLGLALAAVGVVVADRPVLRRDIAANLGASVVSELPRRSGRPWQRRRTRLARERLTVSLARTARDCAQPLSLLELGCARSTSEIALDVARALEADGPVAVVDGLPNSELSRRRPKPGDPTVVSGRQATTVPDGGCLLGVGSVAPGTAWTDLRYLGTQTVLVVRAGHGSAAWLHTVARQLADQRITVVGVVLIDPDPRDRTDGTLWDGLHVALRGHSERTARQNGNGQVKTERQPMWAARVPDSDQEVR